MLRRDVTLRYGFMLVISMVLIKVRGVSVRR